MTMELARRLTSDAITLGCVVGMFVFFGAQVSAARTRHRRKLYRRRLAVQHVAELEGRVVPLAAHARRTNTTPERVPVRRPSLRLVEGCDTSSGARSGSARPVRALSTREVRPAVHP